jgi:hypothetical protein
MFFTFVSFSWRPGLLTGYTSVQPSCNHLLLGTMISITMRWFPSPCDDSLHHAMIPFTLQEHGLGRMKAACIGYSKPPEAVAIMQSIKSMLDPKVRVPNGIRQVLMHLKVLLLSKQHVLFFGPKVRVYMSRYDHSKYNACSCNEAVMHQL